MKKGARELEGEEKKRTGDSIEDEPDYVEKWQKKLNEENLHEDHSTYEDKSTKPLKKP